MSEKDGGWNELWNNFDSNDDDKLGLEKMDICSNLSKISSGSQKEDIDRELVLLQQFRFLEMYYDNAENPDTQRISEEIKIFVDNCNDASLSYYAKRAKETKSILNKWRYYFACWLLNKSDIVSFQNSLTNLENFISIKVNEKKYQNCFQHIFVRYNIPKIYGIEIENDKFIKILIQLVLDVDNSDNIRWSMEPIKVLSDIAKPLDQEIFDKLYAVEQQTANILRSKGEHSAEQKHLELVLYLVDAADIDSESKVKIKKEIHNTTAESHEDAAEKCLQVNNAMAAVMFFQNSIKEYQAAGIDKTEELLEKIRSATEKIEWVEVKSKLKLPIINIKGETSAEILDSISNLKPQIPDQEKIKSLAEELIKNNPISNFAFNMSFNSKNPTKTSNTEKEILQSRIMEQNINTISIGESWIANTVIDLEKEGRISANDIIDFLTSIGLHDEEQIEFIKSGINDHFNENYIGSIHTLIPQIEGTLRVLLKQRGILTLKQYEETIMDKELGGILSVTAVKEFLGNNIIEFLKVKFTEYDGINFRNDVSHALRPFRDFNHTNSFSLIHIIMILESNLDFFHYTLPPHLGTQ